jgi:hypothetical protein
MLVELPSGSKWLMTNITGMIFLWRVVIEPTYFAFDQVIEVVLLGGVCE